MCGIAGIIRKNNVDVTLNEIKRMTDQLVHRGPDAEGQWRFENIGLGHRRLSILDLTDNGKQPMASYDDKYTIVFNGEIYNYLELKEELKILGGRFRNNTDTEVILEAYRQWGTDCVNRFNGMWAFALYDSKKKIVFCSRDRFGVKPFCYLNREDIFLFASEPKAILELCPEEKRYNPTAIHRFLKEMPEDMDNLTFYENILQLEAANCLVYNLQNHSMKQWEYWEINADKIYEQRIKGKNLISEFRNLLEDAIRIRLRSDVELGSSLSGGLDSSTIVGIMAKKFGKKVCTFSSVYEDKDCNEKEYIDAVNEFADTDVNLIYPDDNNNLLEALNDIVIHHDGPNSGASLYSGWSVYKGAAGTVKVLLDGQGADELLGGYLYSYNSRLHDIMKTATWKAKLQTIKLFTIFSKEWPEMEYILSTDIVWRSLGKIKGRLSDKKANTYEKNQNLFLDEFEKKAGKEPTRCMGKVRGELNQELFWQLKQSSIPAILHNVDGNSMAFSLEVRLPFLDYRLAEFCMALDGKYKIKNQWTKWILRKSCKKYLPEKVLNRTNKMGFPAPFGRWLKESGEREKIKKIIFALGEREIVKGEAIQEYYRQHMTGEIDRSVMLYRILTLELWFRRCIDV